MLHYACRDRNLLGMQSDLLGAHAMGLRNVLIITGDPPKVGDYPDATAVFDVDSIGLDQRRVAAEPRARHRRPADRRADRVSHRRGGESRRAEPRRGDAAVRVQGRGGRRVRDDPAGLRRGRVRARSSSASSTAGFRLWPGILPFESARHAEFMANEVPGVRVPESYLHRMRPPDADGRGGRGDRHRARDRRANCGASCRGCRYRQRRGRPLRWPSWALRRVIVPGPLPRARVGL